MLQPKPQQPSGLPELHCSIGAANSLDIPANQFMRIFSRRFRNTHDHLPHTLWGVLRWKLEIARYSNPSRPSSARTSAGRVPEASDAGLQRSSGRATVRITWIGHSTFLLQYKRRNILTDPIFGSCQPPTSNSRRTDKPFSLRSFRCADDSAPRQGCPLLGARGALWMVPEARNRLLPRARVVGVHATFRKDYYPQRSCSARIRS